MDDDKEKDELIGWLFAAVTARIEDAHEIAVSGQAEKLPLRARQLIAGRLRRAARDLEILAMAASILAREAREP